MKTINGSTIDSSFKPVKPLAFAILSALFITLSPTYLSAREFTNSAGVTINAELVGVEGTGTDMIAKLKLDNGQVADVAIRTLSEPDQTYVAKFADQAKGNPDSASSSSEESSSSSGPSVFTDLLDGKLVAVNGKRVSKFEPQGEPEIYAFYFSAHWCPPCRAFTPKLVQFYNDHAQFAGKKFEIVFVSSDHDQDAFDDYMTGDQMPWPAIKYRYAKRIDEVRNYAGSGIPCLVLVDKQGKVLSDSYVDGNYVGPSKVMRDLGDRLK